MGGREWFGSVGSSLFTLVDPEPGHEVEYNRWYERDHFYAGCMIGPWLFAGKRWVATRALKDLRFPRGNTPVASPVEAGSYLATYWVLEDMHEEHFNWASDQVVWLYGNERGFQERIHRHTVLLERPSTHYRDADPVPVELAFDHPYKGLAIVDGGPLAAFDLKSGKLSWKTESYQAGYGSAMLLTPRRGKPLIANLNNDGVILADPKDGTVSDFAQWKTSFRTNSTTPLIAGESVFISTGYKRGCALFKVSGGKLEKAYENKAIQNHMDTCVLVDGFLYGIDGNSNRPRRLLNLVCMNLKTGEVAWRQSGFGCGTVIAAGDRLIILSDRGTLAAVRANPKKFEELGRQDVLRGRCWTPPVLANGRIYCRDARGDMVCVDVSK